MLNVDQVQAISDELSSLESRTDQTRDDEFRNILEDVIQHGDRTSSSVARVYKRDLTHRGKTVAETLPLFKGYVDTVLSNLRSGSTPPTGPVGGKKRHRKTLSKKRVVRRRKLTRRR